ncbi:MAG TPA: SRPBCC family protein [Ktedonobacterales bacterium]
MDISGVQNFPAAPQAVWDALHNSSTLQSAAGVANVQWTDTSVTATVTLPAIAGPFAGEKIVQGQVSENTPPNHMKVTLNRGPVNAIATIDLAADGAGTALTYAVNATISGPMGPAVETMGKGVIQGQLSQFFANLAKAV